MKTKQQPLIFLIFFIFIISGCANEKKPPEISVSVNHEMIKTNMGTYEWETGGWFNRQAIVADSSGPYDIAGHMKRVKKNLEEKICLFFIMLVLGIMNQNV